MREFEYTNYNVWSVTFTQTVICSNSTPMYMQEIKYGGYYLTPPSKMFQLYRGGQFY